MDVERQQGRLYQTLLFEEAEESAPRRNRRRRHRTWPGARSHKRLRRRPRTSLDRRLMEEVTRTDEPEPGVRAGEGEQGAAGVDGMSVSELRAWIASNREDADRLAAGRQLPAATGAWGANPQTGRRDATIGHPDGGGPLVQQAILQVLEPLLDPTFSESSFGFRPGRGARTTRCGRRRSTWPTDAPSSWTWTWRSSSTG